MKLYRIKRISDGKFFAADSMAPNHKVTSATGYNWMYGNKFNSCGAFYKKEETIKRHLRNMCCIWQLKCENNSSWWWLKTKVKSGPHWEDLDLYEVETITIIDHGEKTQPAKDFMGILETAK